MATLTDVLAALAAAGVTLDPEPAAPVATVAPTVAKIASPFAKAGTKAAGPITIADRARTAHPQDRHAQRVMIALSREPGFTCNVDTVAIMSDGSEVPAALHGYTVAKTSGEPCPGVSGLAKGTACPGQVR